jgi:hypothetical protein
LSSPGKRIPTAIQAASRSIACAAAFEITRQLMRQNITNRHSKIGPPNAKNQP